MPVRDNFQRRRRSLASDGAPKNFDDVYEAEISLFPLTTLKEKRRNNG
jgi:hypothetical protein